MATAAADFPMLSFGHTMERTSRYKYKKATKVATKTPTLIEKRETKASNSNEGSALRKVGAFGVSVKKSQAQGYKKYERAIVDRVTSPIEELAEEEEEDKSAINTVRNLPTVEISLTKKIKRHIMLRHAPNAEVLDSSDRQVIEDVRLGLKTRTNEHGGNKSVLEAIGDPKLREARFMYEPLTRFLAGGQTNGANSATRKTQFVKGTNGFKLPTPQEFPQDLRLVNFSVPPSQQHFNTPVDTHLQMSTSHSYRPSRLGTKHGFPTFPKVPNYVGPRQLGAKEDTREGNKRRPATLPEPPKLPDYSLPPSSMLRNEIDNGRKTEFSLPSISLYPQNEKEVTVANNSSLAKKTAGNEERPSNRKDLHLYSRSPRRPPNTTRPRVGRPQIPTTRGETRNVPGAKMTSSGKSHLIGPMNKMDMIVEYSKLLQTKVINYEQYIKKLSKLSLHKIDLGDSGLRQYHIVRDEMTGTKPRLARVDIYPSRPAPVRGHGDAVTSNGKLGTRGDTGQPRRGATASRNDLSGRQVTSVIPQSRGDGGALSTPYDGQAASYKASRLRLSRVSIGEGIPESRFEQYNTGFDIASGEYLTYDDIIRMQGRELGRYTDAHRPHNSEKKNYHWTHMPPTSQGGLMRSDPNSDLYPGYAGRLLPNSREMKKRLNFSYPTYDVAVDGSNRVASEDTKPMTSYGDRDDSTLDPDYLAVTLDQPREKIIQREKTVAPSSLSVHEVTVPTEVKVITAKLPQKATNGVQRKGIVLGNKGASKPSYSTTSPVRGSIESLNITPVAITNSNIVNSNPSSSRSPYYVSQDDFAATGTDGVLQNHLITIYKSIGRVKTKSQEPPKVISPGKNSPPDVVVTRLSPAKASTAPQDVTNTITQNAKMLQPGKRFPPPNTPPPKTPKTMKIKESEPPLHELNKSVSRDENVGPSHHSTTSETSSSLLAVPTISTTGSPPPTAFLLKTREDEITSLDSDDPINDMNEVITVSVIPVNSEDADGPDFSEKMDGLG